ncbi:hypothetical protein CAEBREN_32082 [Caenorhabditis brenneri]|uniref:Uncharacterized protein n=1 Tax=Caenorhabditis brenneri TaxID=135651 RepID=G0MEY0_CAEBE|nr:hypothetical protein CAEBREN_32082 [Caenorhabditis brenneri]
MTEMKKKQITFRKMVDRLEKMRRRATGNGVTHCLLCHTEFGLLASKSYAAMCVDCRKYVCQRNCGVETTDVNQSTGKVETVFLCKICSEAREVLWKKSGAWFYKEMPEFQRPDDRLPYYTPATANGALPNAPSCSTPLAGTPAAGPQPMTMPSTSSCQMTTPKWVSPGSSNPPPVPQMNGPPSPLPNGNRRNTGNGGIDFPSSSRPSICSVLQALDPPDRSKSPRPRIQPRWVNEKVMSSMSVDDEEKAASSSDGESFIQSGVPRRPLNNKTPVQSASTTTSPAPHPTSTTPTSRREANMERFSRHTTSNHQHLYSSDTDDSSPESRPSTRSTSPRHSLATPSSYVHDTCHDTSLPDADTRSIDSGVVQSDHSNPQQSGLTCSSSSLAPLQQQGEHHHHNSGRGSPRRISNPDSHTSRVAQSASGTSLVTPPPPISSRASPDHRTSSPMNVMEHKTSSASTSSSGGTRRVGSVEPTTNNHHNSMHNNHNHNETKRLITQTSRAESPLAAAASFLNSPDDDTKQRTRRRDGVGRINSLQLRTSLDDVAPPVPPITSSKMNGHVVSSEPTPSHQNHVPAPPPVPTVPVVPEEEEEKAITASTESASEPGAVIDERLRTSTSTSSIIESKHASRRGGSLGSVTLTLTYHSADKRLKIHLIRGKNLKAMDSNGFSDPYVKFHLLPGNTKATKLTSKTIEKTLNPEWNEEMSYYGITEEDKEKKILRVTVLDRDRIGSDFLGETRIALKKLNDNEMKKFNLYLESALPVPVQTKEEENEERGKINVGLQYNIQQGSLFININRCVELIGMDSTGFSDPYCKVSLTPITSKAHRGKTSIKKRTLNPEWNEVDSIFKEKETNSIFSNCNLLFHSKIFRKRHFKLEFMIMIWERMTIILVRGILLSTSAKDERGRQWIKCIENPGTLVEAWHRLELDS